MAYEYRDIIAAEFQNIDAAQAQALADLEAARRRLLERRVDVTEIRHKIPIDAWDGSFALRLDPGRRDYASFAGFSDPDGNSWVLQERGYQRH